MALIWICNPNLQPPLVWFCSFDWIHLSTTGAWSMPRRRWKENSGQNLWGWRFHTVFLSQCELDQFPREKRPPRLPQIANRLWLLPPQRVQVMSVCFWQTPFSSSYCDKSSTIWFGSGVAAATMQVDCGGIFGVSVGYFIFPSLWKVSFSTKWFILSDPLIQQEKGCIDLIKRFICEELPFLWTYF